VHDRLTGQTTRVSVASDGAQGNGDSECPSISADGRYVAFASLASNLVPGDTNGRMDIFVHDRLTGQTTRVSVASDGTEGNGDSGFPSISADGRYVAFASLASNLVPGDTNGTWDVFVHDRLTGQTTRVSVASGGAQGNGDSRFPSISADGRYVAFQSYASNLVPGDTNGVLDVFVHDRLTGQTTRVSVASDGTQGDSYSFGSSISADGRYVAFASYASNLVPGDTNGWADVFVAMRQ
jgi:Tol biopolymer transport system component